MLIGYARGATVTPASTAAQVAALANLGVLATNQHVDAGESGLQRGPALTAAIAACGPGDELVVTSLDRLTRYAVNALEIMEELLGQGAALNIAGTTISIDEPASRLAFYAMAGTLNNHELPEPRTAEVGELWLYSVHANTLDYPGGFVVRPHLVTATGVSAANNFVHRYTTLDAARTSLQALGLVCMGRSPTDDDDLVEEWL